MGNYVARPCAALKRFEQGCSPLRPEQLWLARPSGLRHEELEVLSLRDPETHGRAGFPIGPLIHAEIREHLRFGRVGDLVDP